MIRWKSTPFLTYWMIWINCNSLSCIFDNMWWWDVSVHTTTVLLNVVSVLWIRMPMGGIQRGSFFPSHEKQQNPWIYISWFDLCQRKESKWIGCEMITFMIAFLRIGNWKMSWQCQMECGVSVCAHSKNSISSWRLTMEDAFSCTTLVSTMVFFSSNANKKFLLALFTWKLCTALNNEA